LVAAEVEEDTMLPDPAGPVEVGLTGIQICKQEVLELQVKAMPAVTLELLKV